MLSTISTRPLCQEIFGLSSGNSKAGCRCVIYLVASAALLGDCSHDAERITRSRRECHRIPGLNDCIQMDQTARGALGDLVFPMQRHAAVGGLMKLGANIKVSGHPAVAVLRQ